MPLQYTEIDWNTQENEDEYEDNEKKPKHKKISHNRTVKKKHVRKKKSPSVSNNLADFQLPPHPKITKNPPEVVDAFSLHQNDDDDGEDDDQPSYVTPNEYSTNFSSVENNEVNTQSQYYKQFVPYYAKLSGEERPVAPKDPLMDKLNYMIHLLEDQQDEVTDHVNEELVLYLFLGVFVIFTVDAFSQSGKYVR